MSLHLKMMSTVKSVLRQAHRRWFATVSDDTVTLSAGGETAHFGNETPIINERLTGRLQQSNEPILTELLSNIRATDVLWDVGAHVGRYSCLAGQVTSHVVAVEAHPLNAESLKANLRRNNIESTVINRALADQEATISFTVEHNEAGEFIRGSEVSGGDQKSSSHSIAVETITGQQLVAEYECPLPTVLRMDVTGGEPAAIDGMSNLLSECRMVCVTLYPDRYDDDSAVQSRLNELGFEIIEHDGWLCARQRA